MTKIFTVNGRTYTAKEFSFNFLCDLESKGLSLEDIDRKPMSLVRTYLAFSGNMTEEDAGREIEEHLINGGQFNDVVKIMGEQMQDSGFFRALNKSEEKESGATLQKSAKTKKQ